MSITPEQIEKRLLELATQVDIAQENLATAEREYYVHKTDLEIALAKSNES
jgi:hypothetical protein